MLTCLYANIYVSTSRAFMLPTSTDNVFVPNKKSCVKSCHSSATVPSVSPVFLRTSVHYHVIKKPITCHDSIIKCPDKSTVVKNCTTVALCHWTC